MALFVGWCSVFSLNYNRRIDTKHPIHPIVIEYKFSEVLHIQAYVLMCRSRQKEEVSVDENIRNIKESLSSDFTSQISLKVKLD